MARLPWHRAELGLPERIAGESGIVVHLGPGRTRVGAPIDTANASRSGVPVEVDGGRRDTVDGQYVLLCVEAVVEVLDRAGVGRRDLGPRCATVGRPEQSLVPDHRDDAIDTGGRDIAGGPASARL